MSTSQFSLLLPVYHGDDADFLERAFSSSVVDQTLRPTQVVIVEDGPLPTALRERLDALEAGSPVSVTRVRLASNHGLSHALTVGLDHCVHDIVARMDADDIAVPERFAVQVPMLEDGLDLVGSALDEFVEYPDGTASIVGRRVPPLDAAGIRRLLPFHDPFNHPSVVYRQSSVRAAGGYVEMGMMEDYWLFARMITSGSRAANSERSLVQYRVDAGAYGRRGGVRLLISELRLQRALWSAGVTTVGQFLRNVVVRGGYRLVPEALRRRLYRRVFVSDDNT